jgi:acyl transferase domain-containing protein/3-hydroxymyristoyl/3-hydroxydecanoyl-(acyl carrier protein) dehydratase
MRHEQGEPIAIVGFGGVLPGAVEEEEFWSNVLAARDVTSEPPPGRWLLPASRAYDEAVPRIDRVYSTRGGFVSEPRLEFDDLKLDREHLEGLDPLFHLALFAASRAWRSARTEAVDPGRVGVIFGNIVLPTEGSSSYSREIVGAPLARALGISPAEGTGTDPRNAFPAGLPAAFIARALGLGGTAYTLDAACASSLFALKLAIDELGSGRADAMISGGVSRPDPLYTQMGFSQLRALSPRGKPAPFDAEGDGLIVGEGAGLFVLKRLRDAVRDGDTIHAVIRGIGLSNDLHGDLLAPSSEGQLRAMRAAYQQAGWSPQDVDLIECHATGTPIGDSVEIESLKRLWGEGGAGWSAGQCVIGSVKSNVGHMLTAAGAAGLLKILFAFKHKTLPPTANQSRPSPRLALEDSPFRVLRGPETWRQRGRDVPRRAALSGFGFGGINAHVLLEEWTGASTLFEAAGTRPPGRSRPEVAIVGMAAHMGPFTDLRLFQEQVLGEDATRGLEGEVARGASRNGPTSSTPGDPAEVPPGFVLDDFPVAVDRFRIPPRELAEMLPQQSLMLKVAADAIDDACWNPSDALRSAVLVGLGLDANTNNFQLRWWVETRARSWSQALGLNLGEQELDAWIETLRETFSPPLTANRTMGSLGGLVASRIAREFRIGGPSFSVSCEEGSGVQALEIAAGWLRRGEIDSAVVGAVDLAGDPRIVRALERLAGPALAGEGAVAVVLKRLDDALRDGDRVYALVREDEPSLAVPFQERSETGRHASPRVPGPGIAVGGGEGLFGRAGAVTGLAAVVKTALCLYQQVLPEHRVAETRESNHDRSLRRGARYWLRNREDGPRRARVSVVGLGGREHEIVLEAPEEIDLPTTSRAAERLQPTGARRLGLFVLDAADAVAHADRLLGLLDLESSGGIESLARLWWEGHKELPPETSRLAIVATDQRALRKGLETLVSILGDGRSIDPSEIEGTGLRVFPPRPLRDVAARVAFVYPGLGNVFAGMGRVPSVHWPEILREQDARNAALRDQFAPDAFWGGLLPARFEDHRIPILGQVSIGSFHADLMTALGVVPAAAIGYSMGESTALVAHRAWAERDLMARRLMDSPLFATELAGPCLAARRIWGLGPDEPADWVAAIVSHPLAEIEARLAGRARVYLLIRNSPNEAVVGGHRAALLDFLSELRVPLVELPIVSTVHCEIGKSVEDSYRALHDMPTSTPGGLDFYSGVTCRRYRPDRRSAADAITAQASRTIDFPAVIERAYADGIRAFLEMGPGGSCTRLIDLILGDRPHLARTVCRSDRDGLDEIFEALAALLACGGFVDLEKLYGQETRAAGHRAPIPNHLADARRTIVIKINGSPSRSVPEFLLPEVGAMSETVRGGASGLEHVVPTEAFPVPGPSAPARGAELLSAALSENGRVEVARPGGGTPECDRDLSRLSPLTRHVLIAEQARAGAHSAFLASSRGYGELIARNLKLQLGLIEALAHGHAPEFEMPLEAVAALARTSDASRNQPDTSEALDRAGSGDVALDRRACLEFAIGSIGSVLGTAFAEIDAHPTRVRLPDEPLMLVDRIVAIEGEERSLRPGRVVTEHDVLPGAWYLDAGRIPPCIAIESGQADLFLSAYLGIDFVTKGLAVYRLLDATVTFHRGLPGPGAVIRYDIRITRFFRQGETHLFRFEFDGTVDGEPLLTMRDGCAGFFSAEELSAGQGVVARPLDARPRAGIRPDDWIDLVPMAALRMDENQVDALRRGDLAAAFGAPFDRLGLADPLPLPGGPMTLVHRVETLEPRGGRFGLGLIRAEADIRPDDWFMVCHFVDDRVMPGTLMYECCLHTFRIFLMRMGWVGGADRVAFEPLPGVANRLRCRGQVVESTRKVTYEVVVKELGYGPEPYAIADALMYADGKPIVEITDMAIRLAGTTRGELERLWSGIDRVATDRGALFGKEQILAFAVGKPSQGFGDRYRPFDHDRFIARLPGPPYQFLDRIVEVAGEPWRMAEGTAAVAEYDVPPDAWYFEADRQGRMPYAVLLEAALQSCGWVSAYMGSALTSAEPLKFRNLGGTTRQHAVVDRSTGTLRTTVKATRVTRSAGMIIQHYELSVSDASGVVLDGETYFGFFHPDALAEQVGLRDTAPYELTEAERARARSSPLPDRAPFPDRRWRMVDQVDAYVPDGGPHGLGVIEGSAIVDPSAWFFQAHFLDDPVWPGSLGLESLLQLLKFIACDRWNCGASAVFQSPGLDTPQRWIYRGQIVPTNRRVSTRAIVTGVDDERRALKASGHLLVDGKVIYQMDDYTLWVVS